VSLCAAVLAVIGATAAGTVPAAATTTTAMPSLSAARLTGQFTMSGRVTVAVHIRGERAGQKVHRTWTFAPTCPSGQCPEVGLGRMRAAGTDLLRLFRTGPARYSGHGVFYAPLTCGSTTYTRGESVPFTITVRITAAALSAGIPVATAIKATYTNRSRKNLTNCVAVPGHDAATYTGTVNAQSPAGT
jgi:hypothetical protein